MFFVVGVGVVAGGVFCVPLAQSRGSVFGGLCIVSCQWKILSVWLSGQRKDYFVPTAHCLEAKFGPATSYVWLCVWGGGRWGVKGY